MTAGLPAALAALALAAEAAGAAPIDQKALFAHIHKTFNTPPELRLELKDAKPSEVPGFTSARLSLGEGPARQEQDILVSDDGRFYILGPAYALAPSPVAGLRAPVPRPDSPPPPQAHVTQDGRHVIFGGALDLSIDPDAENLKKLKIKGAVASGPASAPVTIVEFSDLQCPHCKRGHDALETTGAAFKGKIRRIFKHYPLTSMHPWSYEAALAAACAAILKPSASFQVEAAYFREQETITKETAAAKAREFALNAGLDASAFSRCLAEQNSKPSVDADIAEGNTLSVGGTPTIFVNGRRLRGYEAREIRAAIEEALANKRP